MNEAIITMITPLDRGKTNLDFDTLQIIYIKKFPKILMFNVLDVSKISENRHIKYLSPISQFKDISCQLIFDELSLWFVTWI